MLDRCVEVLSSGPSADDDTSSETVATKKRKTQKKGGAAAAATAVDGCFQPREFALLEWVLTSLHKCFLHDTDGFMDQAR